MVDIFIALLIALAIFKGYKKGLIVAIVSVLGLIIGLIAAMKLSAIAASYLSGVLTINSKWLPTLSFALVFFVAVLLVNWAGKLIEKTVKFAMLGWVNKLGGIALYLALYMILISVFIFYMNKIGIINTQALADSNLYGFIKNWGPNTLDKIGNALPFVKNIFGDLEKFFDKVASVTPSAQ